jgi:hypothetical protein
MTNRFLGVVIASILTGLILSTTAVRLAAQAPPPPKAPPPPNWIDPRNPPNEDPNWSPARTPDGQPNIEGQWGQASDIITYSIEDPELERAEHTAISGQRPMVGRPIIDPPDGKIPYLPWAMTFAEFLHEQHRKPSKPEYLDPVSRGFQEGLPRINYQGAFQIQQFPGTVVITYDYHHTYRVIPLDARPHVGGDVKLWMGDSRGHWEGNTLVIDVANNNGQTWFAIVGSFHSDALHLVERWTATAPDHIVYVVTIEDPKVYSRPWTLRVDFRRQKVEEQWENAVWEGNMLGGLSQEFWGAAKK